MPTSLTSLNPWSLSTGKKKKNHKLSSISFLSLVSTLLTFTDLHFCFCCLWIFSFFFFFFGYKLTFVYDVTFDIDELAIGSVRLWKLELICALYNYIPIKSYHERHILKLSLKKIPIQMNIFFWKINFDFSEMWPTLLGIWLQNFGTA